MPDFSRFSRPEYTPYVQQLEARIRALEDENKALRRRLQAAHTSKAGIPRGTQIAHLDNPLYVEALRVRLESLAIITEAGCCASAEEFGPSPQELLERGEISQEAYRGFLLVLHRNSGGIGSIPAQALPEPSGDVLEAQAVEVRGGSRPAGVRASARREDSPPPLGRMGDEVEPGVVEWRPDDG